MKLPFLPRLNSLKINVCHSKLTFSVVCGPLFPLPLLSTLTFRNFLSSVSFCHLVIPSFIAVKPHFVQDLQITNNTVCMNMCLYVCGLYVDINICLHLIL